MKASDKDYEVDPARLTDTSKLEKNQLNLLNLVKTFYTTIVSSQASLPLQLRTVCHILNGVVCSHSPESSVDTVNSAIFLRFINPAIVSPQSYNLVQGEIPNGVRRGLTLISKVRRNNFDCFLKSKSVVVCFTCKRVHSLIPIQLYFLPISPKICSFSGSTEPSQPCSLQERGTHGALQSIP